MTETKLPPLPDDPEEASPIQPLSAEEARRLRERNPPPSPWRVVGGQAVVGVLAALAAYAWTGKPVVGQSVAYGVFAVAFPAAVFARAVTRPQAGRGGASWLVWELVKIVLSVAFLVAAPRVVQGVSWLGVLAGVLVATKMYWVALAWPGRRRRNGN